MRVLFLFVGEHHHVFHALPLAAELAALRPDFRIEAAIATQAHWYCVRTVQAAYPGFDIPVRELPVPWALRSLQALKIMSRSGRAARLFGALPWLRQFDAVVVPERTTTMLRHFLGRTRLIFAPHGAGDRAVMLDPRDRHFDFLLVAGEKSERRLLQAGTITPGRYAVNGYVKLDLMHRLASAATRLFDNDRPTVLYAPHFRPELSSWPRFGRAIIEAFRRQDRYNLIVAPHIRLFSEASAAQKQAVRALGEPGRILIDLDSNRLVDMTYTIQADVYLGDVSSQIYEFLARPRPCVFVNAHAVRWQNDPNYQFWNLGEVVDAVPQVLPAVDAAPARHAQFVDAQRRVLADSVGADPVGAAARGAAAIAGYLDAELRGGGQVRAASPAAGVQSARAVRRIGFVLIGGEHQLLHIVPVAAALSHEASVSVVLFAATPALARATTELMRQLRSGPHRMVVMRIPAVLEMLARNPRFNVKLLRLAGHLSQLRGCDALVTAERTSTALRRLPGRNPLMIHLRHGAGDRAIGFERRIAMFDQLIVAGDKDRRRVIAEGLLPAERCHACGYIKLSALRRLRDGAPRLFDNDRPTVFYNPHFAADLSSWPQGRRIVEQIVLSGRFNLVVAPHVKLFATAERAEWLPWEQLADPGKVLVDLGSPRSSDMTYTLGADIYLGDVSSQVYEFVAVPRPCVFLNMHAVPWQGDPNYRMWEMGEVVERVEDVVPALLRARDIHAAQYVEVQRAMVADTLGDTGPDAAACAARVVLESLEAGR